MTHVALIILHYNTPKETHSCLASLRSVTVPGKKFSVVVVDNASREPFELTRTEVEANVQLVRSESNLGFSGGNNLGMQFAIEQFNSEYVCLLNSDTKVAANFLQKLVAFLENNPKIGAVCPLIFFEKGFEFHTTSYAPAVRGSVIWFGGGAIDWRNLHAFHKYVDEVATGQVQDSADEDFLTGCCILIRREVLEKVAGFDDRYFLYLEDVDLSVRIREAGYSLGVCAHAHIWHANAGSSGGAGSRIQQYYQTRNRLLFFWTYGTWRQRLTVLRLISQIMLSGNSTEQTALLHAILNKYGKETAI